MWRLQKNIIMTNFKYLLTLSYLFGGKLLTILKRNIMIKNLSLLLIALFCASVAIGQTTIQGKITEVETGEPVLFAAVALYKNDVLITGTESDFDGNYSFADLSPGTYDVEVTILNLQDQRISGVVAKEGKVNILNVKMEEASILATQQDIVIKEYKVPLVEFDNTTQGKSLTSENIQALPTKNISAIAATSAGVSVDNGGNISIRGSRANATNYYIDGIRISGQGATNNLIPQAQIEQLQIITGGIEARYGDVTGGIISITTKGPSNKYTGGLELETSEGLDPYGYNLANGNISGPILRNKKGQSILGFRFFGQYRNIADDNPSAVGTFRASEELIAELEANPVTQFNGTLFPSAEFVTSRDNDPTNPARVNLLDTNPNETDRDINLSLNLDARLSDNVDVSVSTAYFDSKNRFSPSRAWALYNWQNNPFSYFDGYRASVKLRHKLGRQGSGEDEGEERQDQIIRNASYSIQVGYEKSNTRTEDFRHQDNLFDYGYFGVQPRTWVPQATFLTDPDSWGGEIIQLPNGALLAHQGYLEIVPEEEFTVDPFRNPVLGQINQENGFLEPVVNGAWGLFSNVGQVNNSFTRGENDIITVNVSSGFDFLPGGSEKGKHSIQFGFNYEQRIQRSYSIAPRALWTLMRLQANRHLSGVDTTNVIGTFIGPNDTEFLQYAPNNTAADVDDITSNSFIFNIRELTGQAIDEYVNVDALNPDDLDLSLFSPQELNNFGILNYVGYNYLGENVGSSTTFDDFFTGRDADGNNTFLVAPWTPIYGAGYIQDKFTYKDIIFRLGLRVDYYDANSRVLRDPFSLNRIEDAASFFARNLDLQQPNSVSDDYSVYVAGEGSNQVVGYRQGEQWFRPDGTATDGNLLFGGGLVTPSYVETDLQARNPQSSTFNVEDSFQDYDPQLNFMPRLAFSFPISEDAGFFAHYDVLVQRPPSNVTTTGLDYYFFNSGARFSPSNNPNLRPERTIDYEVGFQQKISNSSAIKVSAYYKELRDMIQSRFFQFVPNVTQYQSFDNIDFGTVKGFSFNYDLRRTGNFQLNATYTLQFADGSGSGANSSSGFNPNVNIRTLLPLSFDERHRFTAVADYRYGSGKSYNGPRIGNADIFANAGVNLLVTTVSGRPYSTFANITEPLTSSVRENINGARLPWVFSADLQFDKNFTFKLSEESKRYLGVNVYLRIQNVLDRDNITNVFSVSGEPDSDGYLLSSFGEQRLQQIEDTNLSVDSFLSNYAWRILSPGNFAAPRQIFLGTIINF
jgi:outer membrane receptor protein involved in Fe transport